jgi:DNA-binding NtrC family response regulator
MGDTVPGSCVAVVADDTSFLEKTHSELSRRGLAVEPFVGADSALEFFRRQPMVDVVCLDLALAGVGDPLELQKGIRRHCPGAQLIVFADSGPLGLALQSVSCGAFCYLRQPVEIEDLVAAIDACLGDPPDRNCDVPGLIGRHRTVRELGDTINNVASLGASSTVLIRGESGTGKEVVARAIHELGGGQGAFVGVNCGAFSPTLLDDQLFGHVRGAFTGAASDKDGVFVAAGGGTLFLDEITEMAVETQVKLLRAIQEREVTPLGSDASVGWNARLIVATNRDVEEEVDQGRFRKDLFYRINVIPIELPPLRDRLEDVPLLAEHFLDQFARQTTRRRRLSREALDVLLGHDYPGNVRELRNALERAVAMSGRRVLEADDLPTEMRGTGSGQTSRFKPLAQLEREHLVSALRLARGKKLRASRYLQIDRNRLYRMIQKHAIEPEEIA